MGLVYAEIEIINADDLAFARRHIIGDEEVKRMPITVLVDTGSYMLAINEEIQEQMQFPVVETRKAQMADGSIIECDVVGSVEVRFKNRRTNCRALVLPGSSDSLFGSIPMQDMDVMIDLKRQELIVNPEHPYFAHTKMKSMFFEEIEMS